jgi:hypothetical protein
MRKVVVLVIMFLTLACQVKAAEYSMGEPQEVTCTATSLVAGTWTLVSGTKFSIIPSLFWRRVFMAERSQQYSFRYTFNPVSYTVVDDYITVSPQILEEWRISMPYGIYASTTWTTGSAITLETITTK